MEKKGGGGKIIVVKRKYLTTRAGGRTALSQLEEREGVNFKLGPRKEGEGQNDLVQKSPRWVASCGEEKRGGQGDGFLVECPVLQETSISSGRKRKNPGPVGSLCSGKREKKTGGDLLERIRIPGDTVGKEGMNRRWKSPGVKYLEKRGFSLYTKVREGERERGGRNDIDCIKSKT